MIKVTIFENDTNQRLDSFVRKYLKNAPLSFIYKLFRKKDVKVNKKPAPIDYITKLNDEISIYITAQQLAEFNKKDIKLSTKKDFEVIFEDDNVLVVNKPINLLVHEGENLNEDDLTKQVLNYLIENNSYDKENENTFVPSLAHRIDRNTSGIVVFGKKHQALQELFKAFKNHDGMEKIYTALVCGRTAKSGTIDAPLSKNEKTKVVSIDYIKGQKALSKYQTIKNYTDVSLLNIRIFTGRTHQIRVHMHHLKHPLVGDKKYGNQQSDVLMKKYQMKNYFLHATKLVFHNLEGSLSYLNEKTFQAPYFDWQKKLIKKLENIKEEKTWM